MKKFYTFEPKNFRIFSKMKSFIAVALLLLMAVGTMNAQTAQLVTDASSLAVGDQIIIVAANANAAMSQTQNNNNRGQVTITKSGSSVSYDEGVQVITLENGATSGTFAMNVSTGYLYAASSSSNYLRTKSSVDGEASWLFTQSGDAVSIEAQGENERNKLRYNSSSHIFSCYASGQGDVAIYKVVVPACTEYILRTDNVSICEYSFDNSRNYYNFYGTNLVPADAGTHIDTVPGVGGACDTIVTLNLSVIPGEYSHSVTINDGESYNFAGDIITTEGDYYHYFNGDVTACGCDSSVTLHVTVIPVDTMYEEVAAACLGSTYTFPLFDGLDTNIICTETNIYTFTKAGAAQGGRDSVRVLYLDVNPTYNEAITDEICQGTEYQFGTGVYGYHFDTDAEPGVYSDLVYTFESALGCDSIVTLTLTINAVYNDTVEATFCDNQLPQMVGDIEVEAGKTSGEYVYDFTSVAGCDSTVVLQLTINPTYEENITETICADALPYDFRGHEWTAAGSETYNETSVNGCDSVVNFTLVVNPLYNEEISDTICPAELASYEFRGHTYTEGGTYNYNETSVNGCDSTVVFNLTVIPVYNREEKDTTICINETPYVYYGQAFSTTGTYVVDLNACGDTTATLHLTVNETDACTFVVDIEAGEHGTIEGATAVNHGSDYEYTITPETCYYIESLTLDGADQTITNPDGMTLTLDSVYANHAIAATFAKYEYTVTAVGTVEPTTTFECGEEAAYTFVAATGYHIDSLYIDGSLNTAVYNESWTNGSWNFTMDRDHSIEVFYSKNHFTVTASATGIGGTISPVGEATYEFDAFPTYTFTMEECIGVHSILIDGEPVAIADSYTFDTLWHNSTIEVLFDTAVYDLTSVFHGPGFGTVNGQPEGVFGTATCASTVRDVFVDADATTHSRIDSVKWNGLVYNAVDAPQYQQHIELLPVTMDGTNNVIDVYFNRENNHVYTHVDAGNGQVQPVDTLVYYTDPVVVVATADHGWHVATITCGTETWTNVNGNADSIVEFTINSVTSDTNVYVTFEINEYTLTINTTGDGTTTPAGPTVTVQYGEDFELTANPTSCTYVDSLVVDGETVSTVSLTNIENDHTIDVYFTLYEYTMTGSGANATVTGDGTVLCGSDYTYTITADEFYHIDSVYVNGAFAESYTGEQSEVTHTETNVTEDKDLTVFASLNHYNLTATATHGTVDPSSASVEHGSDITLQMTPETECYELTEVLVNGVSAMADVQENTVSVSSYAYNFDEIPGGNQACNSSGTTVTLPGWTCTKVYESDGKVKLGSASSKGILTTPEMDLSGNGGAYTITFDAKAWKNDNTSIKVKVGAEEFTVSGLSNADNCEMSNFVINGTNGQANSTVTFEGVNNSSNRFFLDNINVSLGAEATGYTLTLNNVTDITNVEATFDLIEYTMTGLVANDEGGTVTASAATVDCGTEQSYTLEANEGWHVASYTLNGTTNTVSGVVANMDVPTTIAGNDTLIADFDINTYTVTAHIAHQAGSFDQETQVVEHGSSASVTFTADAANGYHIEKIVCGNDIVVLDSNNAVTYTYTVNEVVSDTTVDVYFKHNEFPITVIFDENDGEIAPLTQNWEYGEDVTFTITPNYCKYITSILVDGTAITISDETGMDYTFTNVTAEHTIEAIFADSMFTMAATAMTANGTINSGTAVCGSNFTYNLIADEGYHIDYVFVDGENVPEYSNTNADTIDIEFNDVHGDHIVRVWFAIDYYDINITSNEGGTVTPSGEMNDIVYNTPIDFTFAPEACQELVSFTIDGMEYIDSVENNAYTWNANASGDVIVTFDTIVYEMAESHTGEGTVTDGTVNCNEDYTYTITAAEGYHIESYTIGGTTTTLGNNEDTVATVDVIAASSDTLLDVVFTINGYTVTLCTVDGGTLTTATPNVNHGDNCDVTITADAANGYHIETITCGEDVVNLGANDNVSYTYTITNIVSDTSICAEFDLNNYTITASVSDDVNGEITPSGDTIVKFGDTVSFVIRPLNDCHYISTIVVDEVGTTFYNDSVPYTYTFNNVQANHTLVGNIDIYRYIATTSVNDDNLGTITPTDTLDCGETFNYEVTPITGYHIVSVTVDGVEQTIDDSSTFASSIDDIHADVDIVATFGINHYSIVATAGDNGSVEPAGTTVLEYGQSQTYTITPAPCYYIESITVDGNDVTVDDITGMTYTFSAIDEDHTIDATFAIYQYAMTADFDANMGDVTTEPAQNCGTDYQYIINAATGYHIVSYTIGGITVAPMYTEPNDYVTDTILISPVSQDTNISVVFAINTYTVTTCTGVTGGTLVVNEPVEVNYDENTTVTVRADAANGYHIVSITDNRGGSVDLDGNTDTLYTYNVDNVMEDIEVCATFALNTFVITATATDNGTITPVGDTTVTYGEMIDFVIEPEHTCYYISDVVVDGTSVWTNYTDSISAYTYTFNVSEFDPAVVNHTIDAEFTIFEYTMASNAYTEGTVTSATVNCGTDYDYEIAANYGYHIDRVVLDGVTTYYAGQQTTATVTVSDIHEDHLLNVYFALNHYTVTATAGAHGSIEVAGVTTVAHGDEITYTITPDHCYYISELLVNGAAVDFTTGDSTGATYTFASVEDTMTIHANFDIYVYEMTAVYDATMGTVVEGQANCGTNFTYNVTANEGYHIVSIQVGNLIHNHYGWNIDTTATFNVYNVSQDTVCYVEFAPNTYNIDLTVVGDGTVTPGDTTVEHGAEVTYNMTADAGRHILRVTVDGQIVASYTNADNITTDSYTFSAIDADHTIKVEFNQNEYTITATAGAEGEIVMPGENVVAYNDNINFTITATEPCYHIDRILVDGNVDTTFTNNETHYVYTFNNVDADHTIEAQFAVNTYTVDVTFNGNGTVTPNGTDTLNCGDNATYTITPDAGYEIVSVEVNGQNMGVQNTYSINDIHTNYTIHVEFGQITYNVNAISYGHGTINPMGDSVVAYGSTVVYTLTPDECYTVSEVLVNGVSYLNNAAFDGTTLTLSDVQSDYNIQAYYQVKTYTITSSVQGNGTITEGGVYNCGTDVTFTIAEEDCSTLLTVMVDGQSVGAVYTYTFSSLDTNHTIEARFVQNMYTVTASVNDSVAGTITPTNIFNCGDAPTYEITANEGYHIVNVLVDGQDQGVIESYTFGALHANHTITANFAINTYTLTVNANTGVVIAPVAGDTIVEFGSSVTYTFTADSCYEISDVVLDGESLGAIDTYTFDSVNANHTLMVNATVKTYTITATTNEGGSITPAGETTVTCDGTQSYSITAAAGYYVEDVLVDNVSVGVVSNYVFSGVTEDHTIEVVFAATDSLTYTITATAGANGTITPAGASTVNHGASITYVITPDEYYTIDQVIVDGNVLPTPVASYTFSNVTADHTIDVTFVGDQIGCVTPGIVYTTNVTESSATFNWNDTEAASYTVRYKKVSDSTYTIVPGITGTTYDVTGLDQATEYVWSVKAVCVQDVAESAWSVSSTFVTEEPIDTTGINDAEMSAINVYSYGNDIYVTNESNEQIKDVQVYDMSGRLIHRGLAQNNPEVINVNAANGIYIVRVVTNTTVLNYKVSITQR